MLVCPGAGGNRTRGHWSYRSLVLDLVSSWRYWKYWDSGITRDSKRAFGIFRTLLPRSPENYNGCISALSPRVLIFFLTPHWLAIWRILRRSPLSEENYLNRNPCLEAPLYITEFQVATRKGSRTSLSDSGAIDILKRTGSITKLQKAMGHSSINVSLTYLRGLEVAELKEEDMPMV